MKKAVKICIIVAASLLLLGSLVFVVGMSAINWNFSALSNIRFETNEYEISESFDNVSITSGTADILFAVSNNEKIKVICYEETKQKHTVSVNDGTLEITVNDERKWHDHISIASFSVPKITVYLPEKIHASLSVNASTGDVTLPSGLNFKSIDISLSSGDVTCLTPASGAVKIKTSTGNILTKGMSAESLELTVKSGRVTVSDVTCEKSLTINTSTGKARLESVSCMHLISRGNTGDISLEDVIASKKISIKRSTGDVELDDCDAAELYINTNTGDVEGSLLSEKTFVVKSNTGDIDIPQATSGGRCEIITSTGDIDIEIEEED